MDGDEVTIWFVETLTMY